MKSRWLMILAFLFSAASLSRGQELGLTVELESGGNAILAHAEGPSGNSFRIEATRDLKDWWLVDASHFAPWTFTDPDIDLAVKGYYRLKATQPLAITPHVSWRNSITLPEDPFRSAPVLSGFDQEDVRYIKFSLIVDNLPEVYFQDAARYEFHYNFAVDRLDPFSGLTLEQFNELSLHRQGQRMILGAVLFAPNRREYAIQLVGTDPYPPEMTRFLVESADRAIVKPEDWSRFYFPTFEQAPIADEHSAYFQRHGIEVDAISRWQTGDSCYAEGWSVGRLVFVTASEIEAAYLSGDLLSTDILLTDGVPAEIPFVAGIISTAPATPNSHVAILARAYGVPFVHLADPELVDEAHALAGSDAILRTVQDFSGCTIDLIDATGLESGYRAEILDLKIPPVLDLSPKATYGAISRGVDSSVPSDIQFIGGKAANFGYLRTVIPKHSPSAMAFTFDLWDGYLSQVLPGGDGKTTLGEEISSRLAPYAWPADISQLDAELRGIRELIKDGADFTQSQQVAILAALQDFGFDPMRKIRFRSSTNVEDTGSFVGAGLYDSFSGCLQDDLDGDDLGPSHCDPSKPNERGVFRALRKVYASFYNLNAYIERLRRGADDSLVGMAVLVHHSFPDEFEAANGVLTLQFNGSLTSNNQNSTIVTQVGATSVTNPEGSSFPEVVMSYGFRSNNGGSNDANLTQRSSLLQLGIFSVMDWQRDYLDLVDLAYEVAVAYGADVGRSRFLLEFEFKKLTDGSLVIKQVREVPSNPSAESEYAAFVGEPVVMEIFQGEVADLWSNHRLKSRWVLNTESRWLDAAGLSSTLNLQSDWQYVDDGVVRTRQGSFRDWQSHAFAIGTVGGTSYANDMWSESSFAGTATDFVFSMQLPNSFTYGENPIQTLGDQTVFLEATFTEPQFFFDDFRQVPGTRAFDAVHLVRSVSDRPLEPGAILVEREAMTNTGVNVSIEFWWPSPVSGPVAGYTAPLVKWKETVITGLTSQPITLTGYWSQTYRPGHHNFTEEFLFEPRLEEGIPANILSELEGMNIKQIYVNLGFATPRIRAVGLDDCLRDL